MTVYLHYDSARLCEDGSHLHRQPNDRASSPRRETHRLGETASRMGPHNDNATLKVATSIFVGDSPDQISRIRSC